jgi:hypothetical protein
VQRGCLLLVADMGSSVKLIGKGLRSEKLYDPIRSEEQRANLTGSSEREPYDGDPVRLGVEAMRLGLAYGGRSTHSPVRSSRHRTAQFTRYRLGRPRTKRILVHELSCSVSISEGDRRRWYDSLANAESDFDTRIPVGRVGFKVVQEI